SAWRGEFYDAVDADARLDAVPDAVTPLRLDGWPLVLGASSGFGEAVSVALARAGMNIFGVHLDRKATLGNVERITGEIVARGREARFFNVNAADAERRAEVAAEMQKVLEQRGETGRVRVLLHSLAFGTLKLFIADPMKEAVTQSQMDMTLDVMAHSLVYWTQELVGRGLMTRGGRIFAMTCSGGARVLANYGPVSAAKAALESNLRQLAAGLVQGRTEYLHLASSGHLVLVPRVFGWPDQGLAVDAALHLGTLAALLAYFRGEIIELITGALDRRLGIIIVLATIPGAVAGLLFGKYIEEHVRWPLL